MIECYLLNSCTHSLSTIYETHKQLSLYCFYPPVQSSPRSALLSLFSLFNSLQLKFVTKRPTPFPPAAVLIASTAQKDASFHFAATSSSLFTTSSRYRSQNKLLLTALAVSLNILENLLPLLTLKMFSQF